MDTSTRYCPYCNARSIMLVDTKPMTVKYECGSHEGPDSVGGFFHRGEICIETSTKKIAITVTKEQLEWIARWFCEMDERGQKYITNEEELFAIHLRKILEDKFNEER